MYKWMKKNNGSGTCVANRHIAARRMPEVRECGKKGSAASGQEASGQDGFRRGGHYRWTSFADTPEPTEQYFSWVVTRYGVGETLAKFDENGEIVPCLAKEWSVSEDQLTWTFKIRKVQSSQMARHDT